VQSVRATRSCNPFVVTDLSVVVASQEHQPINWLLRTSRNITFSQSPFAQPARITRSCNPFVVTDSSVVVASQEHQPINDSTEKRTWTSMAPLDVVVFFNREPQHIVVRCSLTTLLQRSHKLVTTNRLQYHVLAEPVRKTRSRNPFMQPVCSNRFIGCCCGSRTPTNKLVTTNKPQYHVLAELIRVTRSRNPFVQSVCSNRFIGCCCVLRTLTNKLVTTNKAQNT
jgi:hypothetical protein